jgi:hypothetical protein
MHESFSPEPNPEEGEAETTSQEAEWHSAFDLLLEEAIQEAPPGVGDLDPTFSAPMLEEFRQLGYGDTCAIRCQEVILHKYGFDVDESTLVHQAITNHLYYPGQATLPKDVGGLLKEYGINIHQYEHANIYTLTVELAQGHEVMIGVNSDELQHPLLAELADHLQIGTADHAVIVSGIDTHDLDHVQVIVSDPSTGEAAAHYPLETFVNAWRDSNFFLVATNESPPQDLDLPEMEHFDYDHGHIEDVAGISYDEFLNYAEAPEEAAHLLEEYHNHELAAHEDPGEHLFPELPAANESLQPDLPDSADIPLLHEDEGRGFGVEDEDDQGHDDVSLDDDLDVDL